jgi:hypothetical protein
MLGATAFGYNEVYAKYLSFVLQWKAMARAPSTDALPNQNAAAAVSSSDIPASLKPTTPIYIAAVDVRKCFDNIKRDKMLDLLSQMFSEDGYTLQRYAMVYAKLGQIFTQYKRQVCLTL